MYIRTDLLCAMIQVPVKVGLAKAIEYFRKVWLSLNILLRFNQLICFFSLLCDTACVQELLESGEIEPTGPDASRPQHKTVIGTSAAGARSRRMVRP